MKQAQFILGLLAGTALGGVVVASTNMPIAGNSGGASGLDKAAVEQIVRDTISNEPKLILDSLQKYTEEQRKQQDSASSEVLKDPAVRDKVFNYAGAAFTGPKDSSRVVVEFFDYNCPACKFMFKGVEGLVAKDKTVKVIFREYPIFGPVSEANSRIGLAVAKLYPEKYFAFHTKMMSHEGRTDEKTALDYAKGLGMDVDKIKLEAAKKETQAILDDDRELGTKLKIQGTPTLVVGDQIIPHALGQDELETLLNGKPPAPEKPADAKPE